MKPPRAWSADPIRRGLWIAVAGIAIGLLAGLGLPTRIGGWGIAAGTTAGRSAVVLRLPRLLPALLPAVAGAVGACIAWFAARALLRRSQSTGRRTLPASASASADEALRPALLALIPWAMIVAAVAAGSPMLFGAAVDLRWPWLAMIGVVLATAIAGGSGVTACVLRVTDRIHPGPLAVFAAALAVMIAMRIPPVPLVTRMEDPAAYLTGDEPSYYMITESLVTDFDIDLADEVEGDAWRRFTSEPTSGHAVPGVEGGRYSVHRPGLPVLLMPAYAVGLGLPGGPRSAVTLVMNLVAALLAAQMFLLVRPTTAPRSLPTAVGAIALIATFPLAPYGSQAYPEIVAALAVVIVARAVLPAPPRWTTWTAPVALAYLPWLHERYAAIALPLALFYLWENRRRPARIGVLIAVGVVSAIGLARYFLTLYGSPFPDPGAHPPLGLYGGVGWLGLYFDSAFGLVPFNPVFLLLPAGVVACVRSGRRSPHVLLLACALPYLLVIGASHEWWGGFSPPTRYVVAVVPLLVPALAAGLTAAGRWLGGLMTAAALALTVYVRRQPAAIYRIEHVFDHSWRFLDPDRFYPDLLDRSDTIATFVLCAWWMAVAVGIAIVVLGPDGIRARTRRPAWVVAGFMIVTAATAIVGGVLAPARAGPDTGALLDTWERQAHPDGRGPVVQTPGPWPDEHGAFQALGFLLEAEASHPGPGARSVDEPDASGGRIVVGYAPTGHLVPVIFGQYLRLPPGRYEARYRMAADIEGDDVIILDVTSEPGTRTRAHRDLAAGDVTNTRDPGHFDTISVPFTLEYAVRDVEARVHVEGASRVRIDAVTIHAVPLDPGDPLRSNRGQT